MLRSPLLLLVLLVASARAQPSAPWQQAVAYEMDVRLDTERHRLNGYQRVVYTNRSPDTLRHVYYHLYFNAFHPDSKMAAYARRLSDPDRRTAPRIFGLGPDEVGWQRIDRLTQDGVPVSFEADDTVLRVDLTAPILPGTSTVFEMDFEAQVPLQTRRSGRDNREGIDYTMTQWYPKIANYDGRGWHAAPYVGREFYGPFGTFDVAITLPARYVVGATGTVQNPEAVGHGYDLAPNDGRTRPGPPSTAGDSLTWRFRAEAVHDFAWSADPDYRHTQFVVEDVPGRTEPVRLHLLYQSDVAERWEPAVGWTAELVRTFSAEIGAYPYPQFTVAQAGDGGMEYPMFTAITGRRSPGSLFGVIAHELAHQWFYGLVGTDEMAFAWMDEGLTDYVDAVATAQIFGGVVGHASARRRIEEAQRLGYYQPPNTFANDFDTDRGYFVASYSGGRALVDLLGYVLGDAVRDEVLHAYVDRFRFRHPTPDDLQEVAEEISGRPLDWLFTPFLEEGARYDIGVERLRTVPAKTGRRSVVTLRRHEPGVLPVDLELVYDDSTRQRVTIPVAEAGGHRAVPRTWTEAQVWPANAETYDLEVEGRVHAVRLDPDDRMIDLDRSNNRAVRGARDVPLHFAGFYAPPPPRPTATTWTLSSIAAGSHDYGLGVGAQVRATTSYGRNRFQLGITLWPAVLADEDRGFDVSPPPPALAPNFSRNAAFLDGIDYTASWARHTGPGPLDEVRLDLQKHLGIVENRVVATRHLGRTPTLRSSIHRLDLTLGHQRRTSDRAFEDFDPAVGNEEVWALEDAYGFDTGFSSAHVLSTRLDYAAGDDLSAVSAFVEVGSGLGETRPPESDAAIATRIALTATQGVRLGPFTGMAGFVVGWGADGLPPQKRFGLGVGSVEARWRSHAYRTFSTLPDAPQQDAHLLPFSGVGPVTYAIAEVRPLGLFTPSGPAPYPTVGNRLIAGTLALTAGPFRLVSFDPAVRRAFDPLRVGVFSGIGTLGRTDRGLLEFVADAGMEIRYDLPALRLRRGLIAQSDVLSGLRLRAKFPLWVSHPERIAPDEDAFAFRWLLGIETGL